ncbi:phage/plasmid replication protein, II/X family [Acinetobacter baumannii]|uniref:phage/plasmid replication protein, II/X family n=1 Tax=Acinetobacter baumannii TaxID=470 RepID=UPI000AF8AA71|nr:phage/plasmid replication protein, II/X family [Acinetobacter baumannii]MCA4350013.1 phage/plasmid replication protein, II/X family [Acinetobacter baumannii]MCB2285201.1 phage/plasmid replication protein, II/X family [Acinetobacter baumannii]MDN8326135.1 phage/plasmid replication protein, II/X family [Acinetobacter baumannii]MDN8375705.1 phage/plasmid replication protein, II/X family [Acinetobacter baumannii]MDN8382864.1 phage/plasmid replication protein, II/X family [Acinetobacter baumanni
MLDKIVMHIPVDASLVDITSDGQHCIFGFDMLDLGLKKVGAWSVYKNDEGEVRPVALNHAYEKLPTSYTSMAFKFFHEGRYYPHVELKASPAKILQGHNVYGTDWIEEGAMEMLGYLAESHPTLYSMLAISETEVLQLDATYSARLRDDNQVAQALDFMRNMSSRHIRKSQKQIVYKNTVYFGSERGKRFARKVYGKSCEFQNQLEEQIKLAKANDKCAQRVVKVMSDPELQAWTKGLLRFETGIKRYVLKELGIPTNLFQLIRYQRENPTFLKDLWVKANSELFKALEGTAMKTTDHESIFKNLCNVFGTVTPSGRKSITKARNLFNFYCALETHGTEAMKLQYGKSQFFAQMADLISAGYSKAFLQNLHVESKNNVIPFIKLVEINFENQVPENFKEPVSTFNQRLLKIA